MQKTYLAPCKINLGLEVLSRRDDGYHNINTVFYKLAEPHDELLVEHSEHFQFTCSHSEIPNDENNIIVKAITLCAETVKIEMPRLHLHLKKNIPSGAGLGGGCSDASKEITIFLEK